MPIPIKIHHQPDDASCGPTSLHAVYHYFKDPIDLKELIPEIPDLEEGGTLAVCLANHALKRGYKAKIYTYNMVVFDPSWRFFSVKVIIEKLKEQARIKKGKKLIGATLAYIEFLISGGEICFEELDPSLFRRYFKRKIPILTGLSSTYLYNCSREVTTSKKVSIHHDVKGTPQGHFVVLCGFKKGEKEVVVADPYEENPFSGGNHYSVSLQRLLNSILLGVLTYDANLLVIEPGGKKP